MTQLLIIIGYLVLLLVLGTISSRLARGTSEDYLLASHSIGPVLLLLSLFGTTMTAFALVGSTGEAYREGVGVYGLLASSSGIIHSLCFFLVGIKLWKLGKRYGYTTQIEFFRDRLESDSIGWVLFPVLVGLVVPYLLLGVSSAGTVINAVTVNEFPELFGGNGGVPKWLASAVICAVVLTYVFWGGMRGTAWANAFQTLVFMGLGMVTFYVIAMRLGGADSLLENMRIVGAQVAPDKLSRHHFSKWMFFTYMLIPLSVGMFPHVFQHWLTARSANSFKLPVVVHPLFIMLLWAPCVLIGVWATTAAANVPDDVSANSVLAYLVRHLAGNVLGGFLTAGILAAIMSSLDSQFLCLGTMFTNDIALHYTKRPISDRQRVLIARLFILVIVLITYGLSLLEPRRVFQMGVWCFSGFSALFPLVIAALYWRRLTAAGAHAGVLAAILSWSYLFWKSDFGLIPNYSVDITLYGTVYQTMPVATILLVSLISMVTVSWISRPPGERTLSRFFSH